MPAVKRMAKSKKGAVRKRSASVAVLANALAEAAWAEADIALAQALAAFDELETPKGGGADAVDLMGQALARAARRRGLVRLGAAGAVEAFDPQRHQLAKAPARPPGAVRIMVRGVSRGGEVLVKARVTLTRAAKRT